jgi:anaerobic carbon-monoxide dehydrogenase iron sulfur subunit
LKLTITDAQRCIGCQSCMFACVRRQGKVGLAETCIGVKSIGGMEKGFTVVVCRACEDPPCAKVCPNSALTPRKGGGVRLDTAKCIGCGHCRESCMLKAIYWNEETNKPVICIHCGYCTAYCPHGVLQILKDVN